jgi:hypothetical protein
LLHSYPGAQYGTIGGDGWEQFSPTFFGWFRLLARLFILVVYRINTSIGWTLVYIYFYTVQRKTPIGH